MLEEASLQMPNLRCFFQLVGLQQTETSSPSLPDVQPFPTALAEPWL